METILQKVSVCELQLEITKLDVSAKINLSNRICSVCKFPTKHGNTDQQEKKGNWFSRMLSFLFTAGVNFLLFTCCLSILFASIIYWTSFFWKEARGNCVKQSLYAWSDIRKFLIFSRGRPGHFYSPTKDIPLLFPDPKPVFSRGHCQHTQMKVNSKISFNLKAATCP